MNELLSKATRTATLCLAAALMIWAIAPQARIYAAGAALGVLASIINMTMLRRRVELLGNVIKDNPESPRRVSLGMASRLATVLLVAMIAYRYPAWFHLPSAIFACFLMPIAALVHAFIDNKRQS